MPLTTKLRGLIIYHKENGAKNREIAKWLKITERSVERILKLYREEQTIESKPHKKGRKPAISDDTMEKIKAKIAKQPDITIEELIEHFELNISISALSRKLRKMNLSFKKRHYLQKSNSARTRNGYGASGWDIFHI